MFFSFLRELKSPFSLFLIVLYCSFQLKISSMLIPKYFALPALLITSLLRTRSGNSLPTLYSCHLWPITIYSLLLVFKLSLFILIQFDKWLLLSSFQNASILSGISGIYFVEINRTCIDSMFRIFDIRIGILAIKCAITLYNYVHNHFTVSWKMKVTKILVARNHF